MPAIGEPLRKARISLGVELEEVATTTAIHVRYLAALESESFDDFPGNTYARSFLREYATYLGLDPQPLLEELDLRLEEDEPGPIMLVSERRPMLSRRALLVVAVSALAVSLIAWQASGGGHERVLVKAHSTHLVKSVSHSRTAKKNATTSVELVLVASRGPCWLSVRGGSETGPVLYENTLQQTGTLHFARAQFWIRLGAPWNLELRLNGRPISMPSSSIPINVLVTNAGVRAV
ncbi:MAG: RodZ domain-containing protein [Gaiellaceae bacterium]